MYKPEKIMYRVCVLGNDKRLMKEVKEDPVNRERDTVFMGWKTQKSKYANFAQINLEV